MSSREAEAARIFLEAVEHHEPGQRAVFVQEAAAGDSLVLQRVDALLKAHGVSNVMLDGDRLVLTEDVPQPTERPGAVVGPYKLLEQIGEGGMGLVFVAEQSRPIRRKVALKLIKPGMDSKQVLARFEAERQALALMDHPNIAKIHDAGTTEAGRPFFVMELVRGVPITEYCDRHRLDVRRRLGLFVQVCQAVQHAHMRGVIHRDLKPGNVLVAHDDTVAVPKVIDFGVAKATTQPLTERTVHTALSQVVGTPLYMSPEQAALHHQDVDTRSDVYALGVLLYELLTGTTPLEGETLRLVGLDEMRRMIREEEPPVPSHRVSTLGAAKLTTLSERRGVEVRRLPQVLRGELDWVVMRALEKDRSRRYESASAFAADVQRYLNDEPVEACPPSAANRLRKYVRRNRRMLLPAGVVATALVAATAVSAWQAVVARDAQHQAERDRDLAKTAQHQAEVAEGRAANDAAIARAVSDFLQKDLLGQVSPDMQLSGGVEPKPGLSVKQALDRAAERIGSHFQDQPLVEAAIRKTIGEAYTTIGEQPLAVTHLERAVTLRTAHLGPDHPATLDCLLSLGQVYVWAAKFTEAVAVHRKVVERNRAALGNQHPVTLGSMRVLGASYRLAGVWREAVEMFEQRLVITSASHPPNHTEVVACVFDLGLVYRDSGRIPEAIALLERAVQGSAANRGPDHAGTRAFEGYLAVAYERGGELDKGERLLRKNLEQVRRERPWNTIRTANVLSHLTANLLKQGKYAEVEPLARESLKLYEASTLHFVDEWKRFHAMSQLGEALVGQRRYADAERLVVQGYEGMKQRVGTIQAPVRDRLAEAAARVVRLYEVTDRPEQARALRDKFAR